MLAPDLLSPIGPDLLWLMLDGLTHLELASVSATNTGLRSAVKGLLASCIEANLDTLGVAALSLVAETKSWAARLGQLCGDENARTAGRLLRTLLLPLKNLQVLHLPNLSGADLVAKGLGELVPRLKVLDLSATAVTSRGVESLKSLQSLEALVLIECALVSYSSVLRLRMLCPKLKLIRRQPEWLDGHYETPWGEVHTYYPCGAFSFRRDIQSKGWVAQSRLRVDTTEPWVEVRLIYTDSEEVDATAGCEGVLITPRDDGTVLVVQSTRHPQPPSSLPPQLSAHGQAHGQPMPTVGETIELDGEMVVSCMRVRPLEAGSTSPSMELQAKLRHFYEHHPAAARKHCEMTALISIERSALGPVPKGYAQGRAY